MVRHTRERGRRTPPRRVRTSSRLRLTGSFCSRGARTKRRVGQSRWRVGSQKHVMPHRAIVLARREYGLTCLMSRQYGRRSSSVITSGEVR